MEEEFLEEYIPRNTSKLPSLQELELYIANVHFVSDTQNCGLNMCNTSTTDEHHQDEGDTGSLLATEELLKGVELNLDALKPLTQGFSTSAESPEDKAPKEKKTNLVKPSNLSKRICKVPKSSSNTLKAYASKKTGKETKKTSI